MLERGFRIEYADMTVIAQRPKLAGYLPAMREKIASVLGVPADRLCTGLPRPSADLQELVSSLTETLEEADEVTLYGSPLSREARKRFSRAVRGAVRELAAAPEGKARS